MDRLLKKIEVFADSAHGAQMRKYVADRYIVHPKRVMETCARFTDDIAILAAALLHDVLEDTKVTRKQLAGFLNTVLTREACEKAMHLVIDLTDVYVKKHYPKLKWHARKVKELERLKNIHPDAQTIKYADIIDNCEEIAAHDPDFAKVYLAECAAILRKLDKGHPVLYKEAVELLDNSRARIAEERPV